MSKTISHRPPRAKDHAASTRTDSRPASGKKQKEPVPSVATAFETIGKSVTSFAKDVGDTAQRLAKSARVFAHTIRSETGRPDKNIVQVIEDGFTDAAQAFAPKPDFTILADEAEEYLDTIRHLAKSDPKLKPAALEMAAQYQGILGAGIATAVWDYQHDPDSRPVAQRQAMDFADAFYREVPTEESLDGVFATYAAVDRDVAKLRRAVARNADTIRTHVSKTARDAAAPLLDAADRSLPMGGIQFQKTLPAGPEAIFLHAADQSHLFARAENAILEPLLTATESRITTLVQSTHVDSKFYREAHLGMAQIHMGDPQTAVRHLESARQIFRDKGEVKPPAKELSTQIEVLHRIAENTPEDTQLAKDRLSEADSMIDLLGHDKGNRDKATLFRIDNLLYTLPHRIQEHDENLQHNPDNIETYHRAVEREHQKIIDYCAKVKSKDPAIVALAHGNGMIQASVQFEKRLDAAMSLRLMGETDDARKVHLDAQSKFTQTLWTLEHTASPTFMHEAMGRMHWANATYTFKTGAVEESLKDLRTLSTTYGASGAAQILKDGSGEVWVHHYGIVDDHGNFSPDIGKPSEIAKWKKIADAALSDKASAMKAMMAGAGVAIVGAASADALFGTHVIGAEVLGGLTLGKIAMMGAGAGLITERGYQVLSAQREISAAYATGIANVTTEELADRGKALAGEVAVCFLAGGAARYVRMGVTTLGAGLRAPLLRGLISESGIVAEGIAFHEFAGAIHGETDRSVLGYFRSILTLRMLAAGSELNLGSLLFPGEKWADAVMRHGFNTAVANIPLQTFESAIARDLSGFGQGYFDGLFGLYAITVGGKVPGTILRAPQIMAQAKAIHQERSARKLITRAETLANTISTLQSNRNYARTPTEKIDLTQKLVTAMRAHAAAYQKLAQMGLYPAEAATAYADGVEAFANVSEAAAQPAFETTPLRQLIARALLLPVAPIFGATGPIDGGGRKIPEGDVTQVGIKRGLGDKAPEVSEPTQPPPQPQKQTQQLRPKFRIPIPALIMTPREPVGRVQVELAPPEHRAKVQALNARLITHGDEADFASAGATNSIDNGMQFFSPYAPALFNITTRVDPSTGAIRAMNVLTTQQLPSATTNTVTATLTIFSPWASTQLSAVYSKARAQQVRDSDPVPPWVLTEIEKVVETYKETSAEGEHKGENIRIQTQFPEWFALVNSGGLTLGDVFSERVLKVFAERLPTEIETELQHALVGKPYRTQNVAPAKPSPPPSGAEPLRPKWMDDPRIASALWVLNPENAPDLRTVSKNFRYNPKGDNDLVYAILEISRAIAGGSPLTNSYLNRLHHLLEAIPQHADLFRPEARTDTTSTESNLEAHLRAAYAESPNVLLRALELLEEDLQSPGAFRGKLRPDFRATQPVKRTEIQQTSPKSGQDGLAEANDQGLRKELRIPDPVTAPPQATPPQAADSDVITRHSSTLATALDGNPNDIIPPLRYGRRDLTGFTSPSGSTFIVRARINAQTGEPLTLGLTTEMPEVEHTAVIDIRVLNGKVINVDANSNQQLHPSVLDTIRRNLMGKPVRAKPLDRGPLDIQGAAPLLSDRRAEPPSRLGIVDGEAGKYPTLPNRQRAAWEADRITTQEFHDALIDHFHPSYFEAVDLLNRREAIIDNWIVREDAVEVDYLNKLNRTTVTSPASRQLYTIDTFLARTHARAEVFAALLDLRVEAQLRTKLGTAAKLTDMDLEAERNHILAEVLSEGIGVHLPIAKGKFSISTAEGVIVLRPDRAEDYASIDLAVQSGDNPGEVLTGGFYCHKSAVGLPFIVINPAMGNRVWGIIRHELQHLRKHASNRLEPHFKMPTPDTVSDYSTALRQHFGIAAKDEILAYLEGATPPQETIATLTKPSGIYDAIAKHRDKIQLNDDAVAVLKQEHSDYVTQQVWAINEAVVKLIDTGWHPEAARHALIDSLSDVPFMNWGAQLPMAIELLMTTPPQRTPPTPTAHEGHRPVLRRFLESTVIPRFSNSVKAINTLAHRQNKKMEAIERETRGPVDTGRLQALRQELQTGNSEMEQLAEVLRLLMDECRGQIQVFQRQHATDAQFRKLSKRLNHMEVLMDKIAAYLRDSGITELQTRLDRLLLIRTAHSQKLMHDSAEKALGTESSSAAPPHIQGKDVARMSAEDQLSHISKLRNTMAQAKSTDEMVRATGLYATYVRRGLLTQQMRSFEFEALMDIATAHPEWMPHLKYAFLGLGGAMKPEQWQHLLQTSIPTPSPGATPRPALSLGTKTRLINDIERYRQKLNPSIQTTPHISKAIDALDAALRKNAPMPHVVVRYGVLIPNMLDNVIRHGAPKENMARYFIVKEGQKPLAEQDPFLAVMEMDVPLDRFVRFLMESNLLLEIDGKHIVTTERTNAAFNNFLMNNFVRRHVTVQEGLLTPELIFHAQRGAITLDVRTKSELKTGAQPDAKPPSPERKVETSASITSPDATMIAGAVALGGAVVGTIAARLYQRAIAAKLRSGETSTPQPKSADDLYLESIPAADAEALRTIPQDQWHKGNYNILRNHQTIREMAKRLDVEMDAETLAYLAKRTITGRMKTVRDMFIGSIDTRESLQAAVYQYKLMHEILGTTPENTQVHRLGGPRRIPINDQYEIAIYEGTSESSCGLDFKLIKKDDSREIATIGLQETNDAIAVVRYQGGRITQTMRNDFLTFSGGVDPMPWMSYVVGRLLVQRAETTGKELRWTAGERVRSTYPHLRAEAYEGEKIEEARAFWTAPNPELDAMLAEYKVTAKRRSELLQQRSLIQRKIGTTPPTPKQEQRLADIREELGVMGNIDERYLPAIMWQRGPRTQHLYDTAAHNLGFNPHNGAPWHRLTDPTQFGRGIFDTASDKTGFDASARTAATALSILTPFSPRGKLEVNYSGAPFIADLGKQALAGLRNFLGLGKPPATKEPVIPAKKQDAAPAIVSHWMDRLPPRLDIGDPIWMRQVNASLQGKDFYGSYRDAYMHMMHNAFATRWDGKNNPVKFNFETDPWANTRFLTALRAVRQRINTAITEYGHALIQTSNDNRSFFTFDTLGDFDEFVVTELQRIRGTEAVPESPVARPPVSDDVEGARVIDLNPLLPQKALAKPALYIEGVSIPREFKDGDRVEIGRDGSHNDISFPKDDMVSRVHAQVVFERQGEFIGRVTDLSSSNGTKVIRAGVPTVLHEGERFNLKAGDVIQVGSHRIYVGEPPPRVKPSEDPNEIAPTWVIPVRFREGEDHFPPEYHPRNRDTDHIWRVQKNDSTGRERLVDIFRANALRDPAQRRWPVNFIVQSKPEAPDNSVVMVGQRFWPGQRAPEAGVKHIQISDGGYAQWAGELRGIFDAQGQLIEVQFNASSGEYGRQSLNASQDDDIRIVRNLLAKVLHLEPTKIRFVR